MIIKKMTATFGCLENKTLELREGLNVVSAPNENGKSTWCAFITAMLYGIDSSQRERAGIKPDKVRYAPWSGSPMAGEMELERGGESITLKRVTKSAEKPMREFTASRTGSAGAVAGMRGADAGKLLTGVSKPVFLSSVFMGQGALAVSNSAELERRIEAIVSTGGEGASYSEADAQLRAWQRRRYYNRTTGAIAETDIEITQRERMLGELRSLAHERAQAESEAAALESELASLRESAADEGARARRSALDRLESARAALREAEDERDRLRESFIALAASLDGSVLSPDEPEKVTQRAAEDVAEARTLRRSVPKRVFAVFAALAAVLTLVLGVTLSQPLLYVSAGLFALTAGLAVTSLKRAKSLKIFENYLLSRYGCTDADGINARAEEYRSRCRERADMQLRLGELEAAVTQAREALTKAQNDAVALSGSGDAQAQLLSQKTARLAALRERLAVMRGKFSALGDPMVIETELMGLRTRRTELKEEYDALELAQQVLAEANAEVQQRFSPELGRLASKYMSVLTGGRYDRLSFDRELNARARLSGEPTDRESVFLSAGARDQLYFALRLAISELALPDDERLPLVLDDALASFDDERMGRAMELLREIAKARQVVLFTCHDRERRYLEASVS